MKAVIVGCGQIAGGYDRDSAPQQILTHAKAFRAAENVELVGAFDSDPNKLRNFCNDWGLGPPLRSLSETIEQLKPDIVSICTPTPTHLSVVKELAKHTIRGVICEKPLAYNFNDAKKITETCKENDIYLLVNYHRRWDIELNSIKKRIQSGEFGKALHGRVLFTKGLIHNGSHFVNLFESFFGPVKEKRPFSASPWQDGDNSVSFELLFQNGFRAVFQSCHPSPYQFNEIDLFFEHKRIEITKAGAEIHETAIQTTGAVPVLASTKKTREGTIHTAMLEVVQNMANTISNGARLTMEAEEALSTLKLCIEINYLANNVLEEI